MWTPLIAVLFAVYSVQATSLRQEIKPLHLHARYGGGFPEPLPKNFGRKLIDNHASKTAEEFVIDRLPKRIIRRTKFGPIQDIHIPGLNLVLPLNFANIEIFGIAGLRIKTVDWRLNKNIVIFNSTAPYILIDVIFDNLGLALDDTFYNETFVTNIRLSTRLLDVVFFASVHFNIEEQDQSLNIDRAEVDLYAREALFDINVVLGLEEVRYVLADIFNNPLDDISDAILKVIVREINDQVLASVKATDIVNHVISMVPDGSNVPKHLITIDNV